MDTVKGVFTCFVVDDNALDRLTTVSFVRKYPFLTITGVFDNAETALQAAGKALPDVLLLDIDMEGRNGLELREQLLQVTACIFITAFPDYALPGFEVNALDFLVKPVTADRFNQSIQRLQAFLDINSKAEQFDHSLSEDSLFIKEGHEHIKIKSGDIMYLEALKDYTRIYTKEKKYCVLTSLGHLVREKPFRQFIRIHRSYAVQQHFVQRFNTKEVLVNNVTLPVSRMYKDALTKLFAP